MPAPCCAASARCSCGWRSASPARPGRAASAGNGDRRGRQRTGRASRRSARSVAGTGAGAGQAALCRVPRQRAYRHAGPPPGHAGGDGRSPRRRRRKAPQLRRGVPGGAQGVAAASRGLIRGELRLLPVLDCDSLLADRIIPAAAGSDSLAMPPPPVAPAGAREGLRDVSWNVMRCHVLSCGGVPGWFSGCPGRRFRRGRDSGR